MLKKALKVTVFMSALITMFAINKPVEVQAATNYVMATTNVNVRTGASTKYNTVAKLETGDEVKVVSSSNGWYKIQYSGSKTGWSSDKYLKEMDGVAKASLNVRTGASTSYKSVDKIQKGQKVVILSSSNGWYKIQYEGKKTGWCSGSYINKTSISSSLSVKKTLTVKAYAYTGGGYTALGTKAKYGTLAVDPTVIPYGTKIYIKELDKVFTAEDCGGGIKGNKIDIYMNTEAACNNWGVKTITLQILK